MLSAIVLIPDLNALNEIVLDIVRDFTCWHTSVFWVMYVPLLCFVTVSSVGNVRISASYLYRPFCLP